MMRLPPIQWAPFLTPSGRRVEMASGHYWIRYGSDWMPALRENDRWWLCGEDWPADDPEEIGERLAHG